MLSPIFKRPILPAGFLCLAGVMWVGFAPKTGTENLSPVAIIDNMIEASEEVKFLRYEMHKHERVEGELTFSKSAIKFNREDFKIYMKQLHPSEGLEVLYIKGQNGDKALINPGKFPWFNISLDPTGDMMRDGQHHTLLETGFDFFIEVIDHLSTKYRAELHELVTLEGVVEQQGMACYHLRLVNPYFEYTTYEVQEEESLRDIAHRLLLNDYKILTLNEEVDDYDDVDPGQAIKLPNDYAKEMELFIDQNTFLPIVIKVYDEMGLYEHYEFTGIQLNETIPDEEFSKSYSAYGF